MQNFLYPCLLDGPISTVTTFNPLYIQVGSGKSSLLNSILKEMRLIHGSIYSGGSITYVPQVCKCPNMCLPYLLYFKAEFPYDGLCYLEL